MTFPVNAALWLLCALAFSGIAFLGEYVALCQIRRHAYRFVPVVRALRGGQYAALLCCAGFIASAALVNSRGTFVATAIGLLVGGILAVPMMVGRLFYQPFLRLLVPVVMLFVSVFNAAGIGAPPTLSLEWPQFLATAGACGLLWLIAEYRRLQDMERWRD